MIDIVVIILIVLISFDTTLFLQSQISQPLFSCVLIGLIVDNVQLGIYVGAISQLIASSYLPVGGSNIPDLQIASNLYLLVFQDETASLQLIGQLLPFIILFSIVFMNVTVIERLILTRYIKQIPYENIKLPFMLNYSFSIHGVLFLIGVYGSFLIIDRFKYLALDLQIYDPTMVLIYIAFFSLGSLAVRYYNRGFKH